MVDEGVSTYEDSSLPTRVMVEAGTTEAQYIASLDKARGKGGGKGKSRGKGNDAANAFTADPTRATQIAELQAAIATASKYGDAPEHRSQTSGAPGGTDAGRPFTNLRASQGRRKEGEGSVGKAIPQGGQHADGARG